VVVCGTVCGVVWYGVWCGVVWCVVCGVWCVVCGVWCVVWWRCGVRAKVEGRREKKGEGRREGKGKRERENTYALLNDRIPVCCILIRSTGKLVVVVLRYLWFHQIK
jgi:hypothetical protein